MQRSSHFSFLFCVVSEVKSPDFQTFFYGLTLVQKKHNLFGHDVTTVTPTKAGNPEYDSKIYCYLNKHNLGVGNGFLFKADSDHNKHDNK